ncbi:MAG: hypothetical protein AAGF66_05170, partial [Cyanobacteria bacterium P01_H01_bin.119]
MLFAIAAVGILVSGLGGCSGSKSDRNRPKLLLTEPYEAPNRLVGSLSEVSPPDVVQQLGQYLERYQPQVDILAPRQGQTLEATSVSVRLQVKDLPLFQDEALGLGPHLRVVLDDGPAEAIYDIQAPLEFTDLAAGSHTLRVWAERPWHESFKNQGAYAEATFHVFTQTPRYAPKGDRPQIAYSQPQGSYGAEPILLDFYLRNAPLHLIAQEDGADDILDWRIRCTINGQSFVFDQWQPIYLTGFKTGLNWVKLELIDETGRLIENAFNSAVRLIDYQPGGDDALSKLMGNDVSIAEIARIVDPDYELPVEPVAESESEPAIEPEPNSDIDADSESGADSQAPAGESDESKDIDDTINGAIDSVDPSVEAVQPSGPDDSEVDEAGLAESQDSLEETESQTVEPEVAPSDRAVDQIEALPSEADDPERDAASERGDSTTSSSDAKASRSQGLEEDNNATMTDPVEAKGSDRVNPPMSKSSSEAELQAAESILEPSQSETVTELNDKAPPEPKLSVPRPADLDQTDKSAESQ